MPVKLKRLLADSLVMSQLTYCDVVWSGRRSQTIKDRLSGICKRSDAWVGDDFETSIDKLWALHRMRMVREMIALGSSAPDALVFKEIEGKTRLHLGEWKSRRRGRSLVGRTSQWRRLWNGMRCPRQRGRHQRRYTIIFSQIKLLMQLKFVMAGSRAILGQEQRSDMI